MPYGSEVAGAAIQYEANDRENTRQKESLGRYGNAVRQYGGYAAQDQDALTNYLQDLSRRRLGYQGQTAANIRGQPRIDASQAGQQDWQGALDQNMQGSGMHLRAGPSGGNPASLAWARNAQQQYNPQLAAQYNLVGNQGYNAGGSMYEQGQLNQLGENDVNLNRLGSLEQQKSGLLEAYRNRKLAEAAQQYGYKGPSQGYYNMQALGQLASLAGTAAGSYSQNQSQNH